jgi:hypothetical protein
MASKKKHAQPAADSKGTYAFVSLGCPKNTVDSERMLGLLQIDGYDLVSNPDGADFVVVRPSLGRIVPCTTAAAFACANERVMSTSRALSMWIAAPS